MATLSIVLRKDRALSDGSYPINVRISHKSKSRYKGVGYSVLPKYFREDVMSDWVKGSHPNAVFINAEIEKTRAEVQAKLTRSTLNGWEFDFDYLLGNTTAKGRRLSEVLNIQSDMAFQNESYGMGKSLVQIKKTVESALGCDPIINDLNIQDTWKISIYLKEKGNNNNTVRWKLQRLSSAVETAQKIWKDEVMKDNPFQDITIRKLPVKRAKLTKEQISQLETASDLKGYKDLARDTFLYAYYMQGMRFENVCLVEKSQIKGKIFSYRMNKGYDHREIVIPEKLQPIIEKYMQLDNGTPYLFPLLKKVHIDKKGFETAKQIINNAINVALKAVAKAIGITANLHFHISRHTWAYHAKKARVSYSVIKDALGHSTYAITEAYLQSLDDDHINAEVNEKMYKD